MNIKGTLNQKEIEEAILKYANDKTGMNFNRVKFIPQSGQHDNDIITVELEAVPVKSTSDYQSQADFQGR